MIPAMLSCPWSRRRLQRYLDADPSAPLTSKEVKRLERHLAACARCDRAVHEHRILRHSLARWRHRFLPDDASLTRLQNLAHRLPEDDIR